MVETSRYMSNAAALKRVGIRLLPGEQMDAAVELEGGLTDELEPSHATLLLTNRRLIRYAAGGHRIDTISVALEDVQAVEVKRGERNRQWVFVGLVFIGGGFLLGLLSLFWLATTVSPLLMAVSLVLIGIVFLLTYAGGIRGEVIVTAGAKRIKCRMKTKALNDMVEFLERFYELKLHAWSLNRPNGVNGNGSPVPQA
ncbi:MAG: hypothetical protein FI707_01185 [SAR202 cluster bacterium]|jgi:hypothetical protein|nr:hypothetical protein [SAR202 cluster bacterium]